jgi:hypothetical protein
MATNTVIYTTPGTITTTVPNACISMKIECYGGGGAGAGATSLTPKAGGGGGSYVKTNAASCSQGQSLVIVVAGTRLGTTGDSTTGNDSYVIINSITVCLARGGTSAIGNSPGVGLNEGCIGDEINKGGDGGIGGADSGGGGGSGTTQRAGSDAVGAIGGVASGDENGLAGSGANGATEGSSGYAGFSYGGGGSGGNYLTENVLGGNGNQGVIKITYTILDQNMLLALY